MTLLKTIVKLQIKVPGLHRVTDMVNSTQGVGYFYIEPNACLELYTLVICISRERNEITQEKTMLLHQNLALLLHNKYNTSLIWDHYINYIQTSGEALFSVDVLKITFLHILFLFFNKEANSPNKQYTSAM